MMIFTHIDAMSYKQTIIISPLPLKTIKPLPGKKSCFWNNGYAA